MSTAATSEKSHDRNLIRYAQRHSLPRDSTRRGRWGELPDYPLVPGVAGGIAGIDYGVVLAAGGANFPDRLPWEGGMKRSYDDIFALLPGAYSWQSAGRLPEPRAYASAVSTSEGVLVLGGENATYVFEDTIWLRWSGVRVESKPGPALPGPLSSSVAVVLDGWVYLAGGYQPGPPRTSTSGFFRFNLSEPAAGWQRLPTWPGPSRAQSVIATAGGAIYLFSGLELGVGSDGNPVANYLTDAFRYKPAQGWERLPDMPWSAVAAPSPAPVLGDPLRVFVFGGVDGREAGRLPRDTRVPDDIVYFDVERHEWCLTIEPWPVPVVTAPAVECAGKWLFVSGETMAGRRTPSVLSWCPR